MKKTTYIEMAADELDRLVARAYKTEDYEFVAVEECGNDSQHAFFDITGEIASYEEEKAALIRKGEPVPLYGNYVLLSTLCADGFLEPGNYLILVCW